MMAPSSPRFREEPPDPDLAPDYAARFKLHGRSRARAALRLKRPTPQPAWFCMAGGVGMELWRDGPQTRVAAPAAA